ncbi:MAG: aldose 1-epimerase family protein [Tannerellaceae bacterium]|nr:aldose 1-epimerase family protein [Tannerellaceae bacterium]
MTELKNDQLAIRIAEKGAELISIINLDSGWEYMWTADPSYWNRHSPVLFPIVGSIWDGKFRVDGSEYSMSQHGFARDSEFELIEKTTESVFYRLTSNPETKQNYPFDFILEIGYKLSGKTIEVIWRVKNESDRWIYFQIGAHPGFCYPGFDPSEEIKGYLLLDTKDNRFQYSLIGEKGCLSKEKPLTMELDNHLLPVKTDSFDKDALIIENRQISKVSLLDKNKSPYLTVRFDAPVLGLWSPPHKKAPFICIEPWYGRCDSTGYQGEFKDKDWIQRLQSGAVFEASYFIDIDC